LPLWFDPEFGAILPVCAICRFHASSAAAGLIADQLFSSMAEVANQVDDIAAAAC